MVLNVTYMETYLFLEYHPIANQWTGNVLKYMKYKKEGSLRRYVVQRLDSNDIVRQG